MKYKGEGFGLDTVVADDGKRHINPLNATHREREQLKQEVLAAGKKWYGNEPWTPKQTRFLFDCFYKAATNTTIVTGTKSIMFSVGRSRDAVGTKLRKVSICYRGDDSCEFSNPDRYRTGSPFAPVDYAVMNMAMDKAGVLNGAATVKWIANVLARSEKEVRKEINRIVKLNDGFLEEEAAATPKQKQTREQRMIQAIRIVLKDMFSKFIASL